MARTTAQELVVLLDYAHERLDDRVKGLSEQEYLWEPVAGCWSVRTGADGVERADLAELDDPGDEPGAADPPFTTIAWRLWHIADCLRIFSDRAFESGPDLEQTEWTVSPLAAIAVVDSEWDRFVGHVKGLSQQEVERPLGPAFGRYAEDSVLAYLLHAVDEVVHHSAEVALLRDLYRASGGGRAWTGGEAAG